MRFGWIVPRLSLSNTRESFDAVGLIEYYSAVSPFETWIFRAVAIENPGNALIRIVDMPAKAQYSWVSGQSKVFWVDNLKGIP